MNDFYNVEYMSERVAALAKERDELRRENADLKLMLDGMTIADKIRETPQTVVKKQYHDGWYHRYYCPVCGKGQKLAKSSVEKWYCERCGQALTTKEKDGDV